ncbi:MAG: hypothetical protein U1E51_24705 [Candidatus Binatia bacterium]|nr:hypothetical protein [Candidatus Binatia bacterium]
MEQVILQSRVVLTALLVVFAGGCAANIPGQPQPQFDAARSSDAAKPEMAGTGVASGLVVHIDPKTGEFLPEPPADGVTPQRANAVKAPAPQFDLVPSPTPGGGVMIDLQGHFQTPLVATIDADGKVTMKHELRAPIGTENK